MAESALVYYVGPIGPVDVPLARAVNVAWGDAVEVADPEVRAGLLAQSENWSPTDPKPADNKPAKAAPAAGASTDAPKE